MTSTTQGEVMDAQQLKTLLEDSERHFNNRLLKKAANTAQIALDFGEQGNAPASELIYANILLNKTYTTNGIYQGETSFFSKALGYIQAAKKILLNNVNETSHLTQILLCEGITHANSHNYPLAETLFQEVFNYSQENEEEEGIILALSAMSRLEILQNKFDKALTLAKDALTFLETGKKANDTKLKAKVYERIAEAHIKRREFSKSLEYSQQLLQLAREINDVEKELIALKYIAIVCGVKANYKIGMQYFLEALDISETIGYRQNTAQILVNIATIYAHLYNYDDAINRYNRILDEFEDVIDDNTLVAVYNNSGNIYYATDRHDEALICFETSLKLAKKYNYQSMIAHSLAQLSRAQMRLKNHDKAFDYATSANSLIAKLGDVNGKQINQLNLAGLYLNKGKLTESLQLGLAGIATAQQMRDDASELRGYRIVANVYKESKEFEKALNYQTKYSLLQEAFSKIQRNRRFLDLEIRHAIKEKQKEIEALTKENEYQSILLSQSDQIARQNEELLQVNEDLKQFAYVASHDLKEPLRMIGSYTQLIEKQFKDSIPPEKKPYFTFIKDGTTRMNNLLDDLLRYATIGKSGIDKDDVDINRILEVCGFNLKVRIEENNGKIDAPKMPTIYSNKPLLQQLFQNLLSNGIKFRKPEVNPIVLVRYEEKEYEHLFSVADNGIGIPEEYQERIFVIFQRLHSRNKYEGTGIGLSICQKIVQKLGGRIWIESKEGEGTTFFFTLPKE